MSQSIADLEVVENEQSDGETLYRALVALGNLVSPSDHGTVLTSSRYLQVCLPLLMQAS